jgi:type VI secretion system protein ImpI
MSSEARLILAVQGEQAERFGSRRQRIFDGCDGSIGRSEDCDWVLSADGVSRLHALVRYLNGLYFIEDRSTNGVLLNGTPLRKGEPAALNDGDRLQIDAFEVSVQVSAQADGADRTMWQTPAAHPARPAQPGARHDGEHRDLLNASSSRAAPQRGPIDPLGANAASGASIPAPPSLFHGQLRPDANGADGLIPGSADVPTAGASVDPLALFDAPSSYMDEPPPAPPAPSWNHTPGAADRFRPPQVESVRHIAPLLPEDWDLSDSQFAPRPERAARAEPRSAPATDIEPASAEPARLAMPQTPPPVTPEPLPTQPLAHTPEPVRQEHAAVTPEESTPVIGQSFVAVPAASTAPVAQSAQPDEPDDSKRVATPAPTPERSGPPQDQQLAEMFHIVIDGLMDVLRARAELKNSFRMPATLIQRAENNPLKFAPNADEAVKKLLAPPNSAFLSGDAALNDAVADIRNHQMAMLAGVRSAFQSLLAQFDPARIEHEAGGAARRLPFGQGQRNWERYKEQFEAMTRDPDESFRRLFGDEFARAYEDQLARLKSGRGEAPRG